LRFHRIEEGNHKLRVTFAEQDGKMIMPSVDAQVQASLWVSFVVGRLQRFARSGYKRSPLEHLDASLALLT
jgi:TetR/AcrR family transcriptional regulator